MPKSLAHLTLLILSFSTLSASAMDLQYVAQVRQLIAKSDPAISPALARLVAQADKQLTAGPWAVTDKTIFAPSHDPHDYVSFGLYTWPNPKTANGLPYITRDGQINPDNQKGDKSDHPRLFEFFNAVHTLGLAAYLTGKPQYAQRTAQILRVFFIDPKTAMNPNLNFAQGVPGVNTGRGIGIIDFNAFPETLDAIRFFEQTAPADLWTDHDRQTFRAWCGHFLDWLSSSKNGHDESHQKNNHGVWYDALTASLADYLNQPDRLRQIVAQSEKRIDQQIKPDGALPLEMSRTRSWHYCIFCLQAYTITAQRARRHNLDLWHYQPKDAGTLDSAVSYLLHFSQTGQSWPHKDIDKREDPAGFYLQVRSLLTPAQDGELIQRMDAYLKSRGPQLDSLQQTLTFAR